MTRTGYRYFFALYALALWIVGLLVLMNNNVLQLFRIINVPVDQPNCNIIVWLIFWAFSAVFAYIANELRT